MKDIHKIANIQSMPGKSHVAYKQTIKTTSKGKESMNSNLCYNRQAGVNYSRLANIKNEVWIFDYVDPKSQRHTAK